MLTALKRPSSRFSAIFPAPFSRSCAIFRAAFTGVNHEEQGEPMFSIERARFRDSKVHLLDQQADFLGRVRPALIPRDGDTTNRLASSSQIEDRV